MKINKWIWAGVMAGVLFAAGCSDDDDEGGTLNVVDTAKWIGHDCQCVGDGCTASGVPLPSPTGNAMVTGCTAVDASDIAGGDKVCLRTIGENFKLVAPTTYFPEGYCSISAVGCEPLEPNAESICGQASYGDVTAMNRCPVGSTLIEFTFDTEIMYKKVRITNKTCARSCNTDADCKQMREKDGDLTCMQKGKAKFCYNEKNFVFEGKTCDYKATSY